MPQKEQLCTITFLQMGQSRGIKTAWLPWQRIALWTAAIFSANRILETTFYLIGKTSDRPFCIENMYRNCVTTC